MKNSQLLKMISVLWGLTLGGCQASSTASPWHLMLAHDQDGNIAQGSSQQITNAVRQGCQIRVAWGNKRVSDPNRTIEHIADPLWVSIRDNVEVEVQIGGFIANLIVLGEPAKDHPRRERFGGTDKVVKWRALLKTDGSFNAIWFYPHSGELVERIPQKHPMKWFADCKPSAVDPLYPL
ncbi:MAG: hypothetical protein ABJN69_08160 [Hellea sp.]